MKASIGNVLINQLKPRDKPYDVRDNKLIGFLVRVNVSGKMLYMCEYVRGKRITIGKVGVLSPIQARDRAKEILADYTKGFDPKLIKQEADILTLRDFIEREYEPWFKANRKSGSKSIKNNIVPFLREYGDTSLTDLDILRIEKWRTMRLENGVQPATVNRNLGAFKAALSKAVEWGFIETNPLARMKALKIDVISRVKFLTPEQEICLREKINQREEMIRAKRDQANAWRKQRSYEELPDLRQQYFVDHIKPMFLITKNTGLRKGELFSLDKENDIDLALKIIKVRDVNSKSSKTRYIPLNEEAFDTVKKLIEQTGPSGLLFPSKNNQKFSDIKKSWNKLLIEAGIHDFRWHDLRHHFASCLVMAGVDLNTVRELLGHADIKMTLRYAHLAPEHKAQAVAKILPLSSVQKI